MGARRYSTSYLKHIGIDPHSFKDEYGVGSDYDIGVDSNTGEILLINNGTGNITYTNEFIDDYINSEDLEEEN